MFQIIDDLDTKSLSSVAYDVTGNAPLTGVIDTDLYKDTYNNNFSNTLLLNVPEYDTKWTMILPGSLIKVSPLKGNVPNWFWRKMHYICFGVKWVKNNG
jgi:hypothetical protein